MRLGESRIDARSAVAAGRLDAGVIRALAEVVGPANVFVRPEDLIPFSFDGTAGLRQMPAAVVFPRSAQDVAGCVTAAATHSMPVVTRGSGTGLSGGSVPTPGSLVVCLARMDKIIEVDPRNLTLRAQAGAIRRPALMDCSIRRILGPCASARLAAMSLRTPAVCVG
jgi:FAD/FMN-containing dehydrogenase